MEQASLIDVPPRAGNTDENQRFTLEHAMAWVKRTAGVEVFDLDVAACEESHHAPEWFGWRFFSNGESFTNGLVEPWRGRVFCNPPWDDIGPWVEKAWRSAWDCERIAMLLPGGRTHRPWWQAWVEPFRDGHDEYGMGRPLAAMDQPSILTTHNPPERFTYGHPGNPRGIGGVVPNFTSVLLVWRRA